MANPGFTGILGLVLGWKNSTLIVPSSAPDIDRTVGMEATTGLTAGMEATTGLTSALRATTGLTKPLTE